MSQFGALRLAGTLAVLCGAVTYAAWQINEYAVSALVKDTATQASLDAASYFVAKMPNLDGVLGGEAVPAEDYAFIDTVIQAKGVDTFKLYDAKGIMVFDSSINKHAGATASQLGKHNPGALAALQQGGQFVKLEDEMEDDEHKLFSETYVPFRHKGELAGVAEVYIDQTNTADVFRSSFKKFAAMIAVLVCFSFALPAIAFFRRNTEKHKADEHIRFMQTHDELTKLPNRQQLTRLLADSMALEPDGQSLVAVHYIDLDWFKDVNEKHGHEAGNEVLRAVAARLSSAVKKSDLVGRLAADEFVVAQCGLPDHVELASLTKRITDVFATPFSVADQKIVISASIGTAVGLCASAQAETLVDNADTAAFVIKSRGRNGHCYFESKFTEARRDFMMIETLVRNAVADDSFELHYQPLFDLRTEKLTGFEALLRLRDDEGRYISPATFIPVAEEIGLIDEIGCRVLRHASVTASFWPKGLQISVNLSAAQFKRRSIVATTRSALAASGLSASRLLLEITESTLLTDTDAVISQLQELKAMGAKIVMDDFGTGYSSLGYMLKFPFDHLKIDRSFITAIGEGNSSARSVVSTIIGLAHALNMGVTGEGVETPEQGAVLRELGCDYVQGFGFGKPVPATEIAAIILKSCSSVPPVLEPIPEAPALAGAETA